jgi:hypothetical protein
VLFSVDHVAIECNTSANLKLLERLA